MNDDTEGLRMRCIELAARDYRPKTDTIFGPVRMNLVLERAELYYQAANYGFGPQEAAYNEGSRVPFLDPTKDND